MVFAATKYDSSGIARKNRLRYRFMLLSLLGFLLLALFFRIGYTPMLFEEPRRGIIALEMMLSGNYVVPTIHGEHYYNKPPVYNWLLVGLFRLFGSADNWMIRLPTVLSLLLMGLANFLFVRTYLSDRVALLSSFFLVTSADIFFSFSMVGEIDLFYSLLVYMQAMVIFHCYQRRQYTALFLLSYLLAALGLLTKGLPSIAFQGITLLVWLGAERQWRLLFGWRHWLGIALFLGITGGYFYLYAQYNNPFSFLYRLLTESSQRTAASREITDMLKHLFAFPLIFLKIHLPWTLLLLFMFRRNAGKEIWNTAFLRFSTLFVLSNVIIYWLSPGTRDRYLYMFIPFVMPMLAYFYCHDTSGSRWKHRVFYGITGGVMILSVFVLAALPVIPYTASVSHVGWWAGLLTLSMAGLCWLFFRYQGYQLYAFLFACALLRFGFDAVMIPARYHNEQYAHYQQAAAQMVEIANGRSIYLTDFQAAETSDTLHLPLGVHVPVHYESVPYVPYQIPFYITRATGKIMRTNYQVDKNVFYLAYASFIEGKPVKEWYRFYSREIDGYYVLFTYL